jgi:hypothetical protein
VPVLGRPLYRTALGVSLVAPVIDRYGATPVVFMVGILLPALGLWFAGQLAQGKAPGHRLPSDRYSFAALFRSERAWAW